jgi:hypothetical protein
VGACTSYAKRKIRERQERVSCTKQRWVRS